MDICLKWHKLSLLHIQTPAHTDPTSVQLSTCFTGWRICLWKHPLLLPALLQTCGSWLTLNQSLSVPSCFDLNWTCGRSQCGKRAFLSHSEGHCHHQVGSSTDPVRQLIKKVLREYIDWLLLIPCGLGRDLGYGIHLNVLRAEGTGVWKTKFTEKKVSKHCCFR